MNERRRFLLLALTMIAACAVILAITIGILYVEEIAECRRLLQATIQSQARLIEAVARYDSEQAKLTHDKEPDYDPSAATLTQIVDSHKHHKGFGETGEFLLGRREGDTIVFLLQRRHEADGHSDSVPFDSDLAEPMRRALKGQSGTVISLDHRGKTVLAAYEPVAVLNLGIVAKIDMAEIRTPFIRSGLIAGAIAFLVVVAVTVMFFRIGNPLIARLEAYSQDLEREVEERKKTEKELRKSEENVRLMVSEVRDYAILMLDPNGIISSWNEGAQRIKGYTSDEIIGEHFSRFYPKEDVDCGKPGRELEVATAEGRFEDEGWRVRKDGSQFWANVVITALRDGQGELIGFSKVTRDVTERKQAEEETARQQRIVSAINVVFEKAITCESEEDLASTCLEVSQDLVGAEFGFIGEVSPEGKFDTLAISDPGWKECRMPESHAVKIIKGMEIRGMQFLPLKDGMARIFNDPSHHPDSVGTPEGHPVITSLLVVPLTYSGRVIGEIGLGNKERGYDEHDLQAMVSLSVAIVESLMRKRAELGLATYRHHLEEAVQELERSNKELEQFAYVASHDLQEPLRMVASYTQLLGQRYKDQLDQDANEFIEYAVDGANRMQKLINDLLEYSQIATRGKTPEPTDSHSALGEALVGLGQAIDEGRALVTNDELPTVRADRSQLVRLFQNLIGNGIKFHGRQPPRVHVSAQKRGREWVFSVRDNGIGINPEYRERIFEVFQRLHTRGEHPGTGIGLAICQRIVTRHGGRIWVESEPGNGSTFYFTFRE